MTSPAVLVISGSDSSGGAGLQRDLCVLADCKVRAVSAITAVTAQTDHAVASILILPPDVIFEQIKAALQTCPVMAVKIGMLGNAETVAVVVDCLADFQNIPIILDPVLASSSGCVLLDKKGQEVLRTLLLPMVTVLTPNLPEAAALLGGDLADSENCLIDQACRLLDLGPYAVLLKGGHGTSDQSTDVLFEKNNEPIRLSAPRRAARARGTGCALSTAIAAGMANRKTLIEACHAAKTYVLQKMENLYGI